MTVNIRDIEKLKALGYHVHKNAIPEWRASHVSDWRTIFPGEEAAWKDAKAHAQSPEGMKATMADKVRFIKSIDLWIEVDGRWTANADAWGDSPEAAVDSLFWKVP